MGDSETSIFPHILVFSISRCLAAPKAPAVLERQPRTRAETASVDLQNQVIDRLRDQSNDFVVPTDLPAKRQKAWENVAFCAD
jgi:hypothetical protein